jgi:acyl-CoA thioesterase I
VKERDMLKVRELVMCVTVVAVVCGYAMVGRGAETIRVAVISDSTGKTGWVELLGKKLGGEYKVGNFSAGAVTFIRMPARSVWARREKDNALQFRPNIVIIELGAVEGAPYFWAKKGQIPADYRALIAVFTAKLNPKPTVYVCTPWRMHDDIYGISADILNNEVVPLLRKIAEEDKLPLIDLNAVTATKPEWFPLGLETNAEGNDLVAGAVAKAILAGKAGAAAEPAKDTTEPAKTTDPAKTKKD